MGDIDKAVSLITKIANDNSHGYDQVNRLGPDYDCSSLVAHCLAESGFNVLRTSWTGNIVPQLLKDGWEILPINSERKAGDIFVHTDNHIVMCINSSQVAYASLNEYGKITGGKPGDQTGNEIKIGNFYIPSYGWQYHLRYNAGQPCEIEIGETYSTITLKVHNLSFGDKNFSVAICQTLLRLHGYSIGIFGIDGEYGTCTENAVKKFQGDKKLPVTGVCDGKTWGALSE